MCGYIDLKALSALGCEPVKPTMPVGGWYVQSDPIGLLRDYSDPQLQAAIGAGALQQVEGNDSVLNHLYGYAKQNPLLYADPYGLFPAPWCSKWDILLGQCPDVGDDIKPEDVPKKWIEKKLKEWEDKPCNEVENACKRALGPACYAAGTPCLAPCEVLKQKCEEEKDKLKNACDS